MNTGHRHKKIHWIYILNKYIYIKKHQTNYVQDNKYTELNHKIQNRQGIRHPKQKRWIRQSF